MSGPLDGDDGTAPARHCPTCGQPYRACGTPWPPSAGDTPLTCRLPAGHRSAEHWHHAVWPGTADLLWYDDEQEQQQ